MAKLGHKFLLAHCNSGTKRLARSNVQIERISNTISSRSCPKNSRKKEHVGFVSGITKDGQEIITLKNPQKIHRFLIDVMTHL